MGAKFCFKKRYWVPRRLFSTSEGSKSLKNQPAGTPFRLYTPSLTDKTVKKSRFRRKVAPEGAIKNSDLRLPAPVSTEKYTVIDIFIGVRYPHGEFACGDCDLTV